MGSALRYCDYMNTPLGDMAIQASAQGITGVFFSTAQDHDIMANEITNCCKEQLKEYFDGKIRAFNLPLDQHGTPFQESIWTCLTKIPFGQVVSYQDIADMANNSKAVRAVGTANGKNSIGIIVPCHRVIGKDKTLSGYAGGWERKLWLLKHEGIVFEGSLNPHVKSTPLDNNS